MRLVALVLCHNDIIYLKNLIPQLEKFCDEIVVVDDMSSDGSYEYLQLCPKVKLTQHEFKFDFAEQRNWGINFIQNGDWILRVDSDEMPTNKMVDGLRDTIEFLDENGIDRATLSIYHLTKFSVCKETVGIELRLFKKYPSTVYQGKTHEHLHAEFKGTGSELPSWQGLVHFKYMDKSKLDMTETAYLDNAIYDKKDWEARKRIPQSFLPCFIEYKVSDELKEYLCHSTTLCAEKQ